MVISTFPQQTKQQLKFVLENYFITDAASLYEVKTLFGAFVDLVTENTNNQYTELSRKAVKHAADDFKGMLYSMQLCGEVLARPAPDDELLRTIEMRAFIQLFFFDLRSMFDYMLMATLIVFSDDINGASTNFAKSLQKLLRDTQHTPGFAGFRNNVRQNRTESLTCFGNELVSLWLDSQWFDEFNSWRNGIAHEGFFLAANMGNPDLFRIETIQGDFPLESGSLPATVFEADHAVSFKIFSGLYSGLMIFLLNCWSEQLRIKAGLPVGRRAYSGRGGTVCQANIKAALAALQ